MRVAHLWFIRAVANTSKAISNSAVFLSEMYPRKDDEDAERVLQLFC